MGEKKKDEGGLEEPVIIEHVYKKKELFGRRKSQLTAAVFVYLVGDHCLPHHLAVGTEW